MKTIVKTLFLCGIIVLTAFSCEKEVQYDEVALEYSKCPCDHETDFIKSIAIENILLFDSTKTTFSEMKELSLNGECSNFISYSLESDNTVFYSFCNPYSNNITTVHIGYICNFPEVAKKWEIPFNGIYISFSADVFDACHGSSSIGFLQTYSDNVLTSLKKLKK